MMLSVILQSMLKIKIFVALCYFCLSLDDFFNNKKTMSDEKFKTTKTLYLKIGINIQFGINIYNKLI